MRELYWALLNRVDKRSIKLGLVAPEDSAEWWHFVAEYLSDAAMAVRLKKIPAVAVWLRNATLSVVRRSVEDWGGSAFLEGREKPPVGHPETPHLSWGVAVALDIAADIFTEGERDEISEALREKGAALCLRRLDLDDRLTNSRCALIAGVAATGAVLGDRNLIDRAVVEFNRCADIFQPDGSSAESLQYGNYAAYSLAIARESLVRRDASLSESLPLTPYALIPRWDAASLFYQKPLDGWGSHPRPRSANFNDSAALFRPSADLLLHIAVRAKESHPTEAGLARWLFDTHYLPCIEQEPHHLASLGFYNDFGFLTFPLLPLAASPLSPEAAGLKSLETFSCGDVFARDGWNGRTVLAIRGGGDHLHGPGHLHGDLNSFILVHNRERLLLDPGHSCYRNLYRDLDISTLSHNTCVFFEDGKPLIQQSHQRQRAFDPGTGIVEPPAAQRGKRLFAERQDDVTIVASEVSSLYGDPITGFTRIWILCGVHAIFIVDRVCSSRPVRACWNWLFNNRDDLLNLKLVHPDRLVARRGNAGMKLFHLGTGELQTPLHGYVHDAYHPKPAQLGEGRPGSGSLVRWIEPIAATQRLSVHVITLDDPGTIAGWHLKHDEAVNAVLNDPDHAEMWKLTATETKVLVTDAVNDRRYEWNIA